MKSDSVQSLLPALAAAIAAMDDPKKNKKNDHFRNSYADLGAVLECLTQPLADHGLLLTQTVEVVHGEHPSETEQKLVTRVWHCKSGEWIESEILLQPEKATPQGYASAMTYARRYAIKALFGMSDVDDDGNAASGTGNGAKRDGFSLVEEAIAAIDASKSKSDLLAIGQRIGASGFKGEDHKRATETYKNRLAALNGASK